MSVRILIVDDHKIVRQGLHTLIQSEAELEVVAEASDGQQAVEKALECSPQVVIMDVSMPTLNGIEATRQILAKKPRTKIIALSMHADRVYVMQALKAGAVGYLLKDSAFEELLKAIREVLKGHVFLSAHITDLVVKEYVAGVSATPPGANAFSLLTSREREVLQQIAEGKSTKEIAQSLRVSVKTIETFRHQVMEKVNLHTVAELTKYAIREGLTLL